MLIYFAGPIFNEAKHAFNAHLTGKLEALSFAVFLPQRDGIDIISLPYSEMTIDECYKK